MVTSHSLSLTGLTGSTTYHYRVKSKDASNNLATSGDYTFTTSDITPPTISGVSASGITGTGATIIWTTNEASDSQVEYGLTTSYGASTALNTAMVTSHSLSLTGLTGSTTYHYRVKSKDASNNLATSGDYLFTTAVGSDIAAPIISGVSASNITDTGATISWITDEASDSQIEYGITASYGSSTSLRNALVTLHSQSLTGLVAGAIYHYRVKSADAAGYQAVSADYTFATLPPIDIATGLVAAYSFDEGTGATSADLSGSGNVASIYSANWTNGKYGKALSFNGSSSHVTAGVARMPDVNQPKTISCWVYLLSKPKSMQSILALANPWAGALVQYGYKRSQTGVLAFGDSWMLVAQPPSLNTWHHFGYVFDGTQNRLYIDGVLAGTSTIEPAAAPVTDFQIGRSVGGSEYFKGGIDDVRVYNRALSLNELRSAMNTPVGNSTVPVADPTDALLSAEEDVPETGTASQPPVNPSIDIQLERQSYQRGETVNVAAFWVSNPSTQSSDVEVKTWIALPGLLPIPLDLGAADMLTLVPGFAQDYGATSVLRLSANAPAGTGEVNGRLLDPVTGSMLTEDINPFTITLAKGSQSTNYPVVQTAPVMMLGSYMANSRMQYTIVNTGAASKAIEFKVWLEAEGANPISVFSAGVDGSLVLPAGSDITLDPFVSLPAPAGNCVVRARVLDTASGEILSEK
jgi:hypothetical protein